MRIGLLADLHANREAVEACLDELREAGCTRWVFLGDLVGYGADPGWVVDCVRDHVEAGAHAVLGNHDEAALAAGSAPMHGEAEAAMAWTRTRLDQAQKAFLGGLPLTIHDEDRFYAHANAWDPGGWAYVHNRLAAARSLSATRERLSFCGHVHEPALYHDLEGGAGHFSPRRGTAIPLSGARRWLVIPGSCGQPRDRDPAACCAHYDTAGAQLTFLRVPYDHETAAAKIRAAGLPAAFADRLVAGA